MRWAATGIILLSSLLALARRADATQTVVYSGGPVIGSVKVVAIFWDATLPNQSELTALYEDVVGSTYMDWLAEYSTPSAIIGRGTFWGAIVDTGAPAQATITTDAVQTEIVRLIDSGAIPPPDGSTYYAVHIPSTRSVVACVGFPKTSCSTSCATDGFCGLHSSAFTGGLSFFYGVIMDASGACTDACAPDGATLDATTAVATHELVETVTDPQGITGWVDPMYGPAGEIADLCNAEHGMVGGHVVQLIWSNQDQACIVEPVDDFSLAVSPLLPAAKAGTDAVVQIDTNVVQGASQPIALSIGAFPVGVTATLSPATINAGDSATLTFSEGSGQAPSITSFRITAVGATATRAVAGAFSVTQGVPTLTSITPSMGLSTGGQAVTIAGSNFVAGATVMLGGQPLGSLVITPTSITGTTPVHAAGLAGISFVAPGGDSAVLTDAYTYTTAPAPTISSLDVAYGPRTGGSAVNVSGAHFVAGTKVAVDGGFVPVLSVTDGEIMIVTSPHAPGTVGMTVTLPDGQSAHLADAFTFFEIGPPVATELSPASGPSSGGTAVTIDGSGFTIDAKVLFGKLPASRVVVVHDTLLIAVAPAHAAGVVDVTVADAVSDTSTLGGAFTYVDEPGDLGADAASADLAEAPTSETSSGCSMTARGQGSLAPCLLVLVCLLASRRRARALALVAMLGACETSEEAPQDLSVPALDGSPALDASVAPLAATKIGPSGGELISADGMCVVEIAPGALSAAVDFTLTPKATVLGNGYLLSPPTAFTAPVRVSFSYGLVPVVDARLRGMPVVRIDGATETALPRHGIDRALYRISAETRGAGTFVLMTDDCNTGVACPPELSCVAGVGCAQPCHGDGDCAGGASCDGDTCEVHICGAASECAVGATCAVDHTCAFACDGGCGEADGG